MASLARLKKRAEDGNDAEAWYRFGVAAASQHRDEAIEALRAALEREPNAALAAAIGRSLETLGDVAAAEQAYRCSLERDAGLSEAHGFLGALLLRSGRKPSGLRSLARWADLTVDPSAAHVKLALLLIAQEEHASAADHLQIAVALAPDHLVALKALGTAYARLGNHEGCLRARQAVCRLSPNDRYAAAEFGAALSGAGRHTEAIEVLTTVAARSPPFWELHLHLGRALREAGRTGEAGDHLSSAARMAPNVGAVHFEIGCLLKDLDRPAEAAASFERAIELDPRSAEAHHRLGLLLSSLGRSDDAQVSLVRASSLAPSDARIKRSLAEVLEARKAIEGMGGSLAVIALQDLLQFLHSSRASGLLTIRRGAELTAIRFAQGNLQEVATPTRAYTDEAGMVMGMTELLAVDGGAFDFDHSEQAGDGIDPRFVLMEAMRRLDEQRRPH